MLKFRKGSIHSISPEFVAERIVMSGNIKPNEALDIAKSMKNMNLNPATRGKATAKAVAKKTATRAVTKKPAAKKKPKHGPK